MQVQHFLRERGVRFEVLPHEPTFSAQRMAHAVHVAGDWVAKCVLLRVDGLSENGRYVLAILPATHQIYFDMAREALDAATIELAAERELQRVFRDCESGVVPPFGSQYGIDTLVDSSLTEDDEIVFESNRHRESIRMSFRSFVEVEHPQIALFAYHVY